MNIKFVNVSFYYDSILPGNRPVLNDISLEISENEFVGIIGPSGSGKTTLIQHFTGLLKPNDGKIFVNNVDIQSSSANINLIRQQVGLVFQFPESQIFEETVYRDVAFGPKNLDLTEDQIDERVRETFNLMGLEYEEMKNRSPFRLSEGEKRRIALAGILVMNPDMLVLDEPTACLDVGGIKKIEQLLFNLNKWGKIIVLVSHNIDFILRLCKRIIVLNNGKIIFDGSREIFIKKRKILDDLGIEEPRIIRYSNELNSLGYISGNNIFEIENIKKELGV